MQDYRLQEKMALDRTLKKCTRTQYLSVAMIQTPTDKRKTLRNPL